VLLAIYFAVGALAAVACTDPQSNTCGVDKCETVGDTQVCTECKTNGNVPINGVCVAVGDNKVSTAVCKKKDGSANVGADDKACGLCDAVDKYFLYKGSCYGTDNELGQKLCTKAAAGVCTIAASGYFVPPDAQKAAQSVISCSEQATIAVNSKNFKGVTNCLVCDAPTATTADPNLPTCTTCEDGYFGATCTACTDQNCATCNGGAGKCTKCKAAVDNKYLKKGDTVDANTCVSASACTTGALYYTNDTDTTESGKTCKKCSEGVANCAECTAPGSLGSSPVCTKCATPNYLKTVDGTTTCVEKDACKDDFFPKEDNSNGHKCVSCGDETSGVPNCVKCTAPSSAGQKPACSECTSGYKLEGEACVSAGGPNLSTGAIAGISIAVIAVVGGLVGFLCWWFICRGKA
ncbi:Variant-specific surface protein, partial [Giardia duodenalis]